MRAGRPKRHGAKQLWRSRGAWCGAAKGFFSREFPSRATAPHLLERSTGKENPAVERRKQRRERSENCTTA